VFTSDLAVMSAKDILLSCCFMTDSCCEENVDCNADGDY
jgi:hypothetical protein